MTLRHNLRAGLGVGDANLYRYCGNSPLVYVDPAGLCFAGLSNNATLSGGTPWRINQVHPT